MNHLKADKLGKGFGRRILFRALSFEVHGGQRLGIAGANGAGKSTLLKILAGVMQPGAGKVDLVIEESSIHPDDRPLLSGLIAPYLNLYDGLTLRENLEFITRTRRIPDAGSKINVLLQRVQMDRRADDLVYTFSSGMKQRGRFAAALLTEPPVLLLDEPLSNLDESGILMVEHLIREEQTLGKIVVIASNDRRDLDPCDVSIRIEGKGTVE